MAPIKIVALGSSFAAGPGIEPVADQAARRSSRNYASLLAQQLGAKLVDLTVSGATLLNVLDTQQQLTKLLPKFPPQLSKLPSDADVVTLTGGGNDLEYSGGMLSESILASLPFWLAWLLAWFMSSTTTVPNTMELAGRFVAIIDRVREVAPEAKIYLVTYIRMFGPATRPSIDVPLDKAAVSRYVDLHHILLEAYQTAVKLRPGVKLIDTDALSVGHEVGSKQPWVTGFNLGMLWRGEVPYHPNLEAHKAIAAVLHKAISAEESS